MFMLFLFHNNDLYDLIDLKNQESVENENLIYNK